MISSPSNSANNPKPFKRSFDIANLVDTNEDNVALKISSLICEKQSCSLEWNQNLFSTPTEQLTKYKKETEKRNAILTDKNINFNKSSDIVVVNKDNEEELCKMPQLLPEVFFYSINI